MIRAVTGAAAWCRAAETDDDDAAGYHRVCEEFLAALSLNPCVIIIDGIDELRDSDGLTPQKVGPSAAGRFFFFLYWTSAVLRLECSIDCISGSVGHQQNIFRSFSHCRHFF